MIRIGDRVSMFFLFGISLSTLVGVYFVHKEKRATRNELIMKAQIQK